MPTTVRPQKTALIVAKRVVEEIHRGGFSAGDRLPPERVMLEDYGVGRGTLREALRFLELQGILTLKPGPGGGPVIEQPDATHLANGLMLLLQFSDARFSMIVEARHDLEPIMARHAASRMDEDAMTRLTSSVDQMRDNLTDREIFLATNREFHEVIAWGSGNAMYGFLIDALIDIVDGTHMGVDYPERRRQAILAAHERILGALHDHDGDSSHAAMSEHMGEFVKYMERHYADVLDRTVTWGR
ncbi:GntR family transcriptional regulator [Ornithinimicrobium humiphilum]|uniref:GntR family transcriptional regulator n=1 Tax=Ornithinimicrobium humiphilum TaxID=125288 RepID=A0A543KRS5_9MICO|nr:FCD domain-containing protein [Ornithinimicrobium humiphilum]TQM97774.1 GntR family transcriptional regulator [Ornithinimicrobium humiphilum]